MVEREVLVVVVVVVVVVTSRRDLTVVMSLVAASIVDVHRKVLQLKKQRNISNLKNRIFFSKD